MEVKPEVGPGSNALIGNVSGKRTNQAQLM
jgi:hypothetical protein